MVTEAATEIEQCKAPGDPNRCRYGGPDGHDNCREKCIYVPTVDRLRAEVDRPRSLVGHATVPTSLLESAMTELIELHHSSRTVHIHCDGDPEECSVEAMQGEFTERTRQRDEARALNALLRKALEAHCDCENPDNMPPTDWHSGAVTPHHVDCVLYPFDLPDPATAPSAYADAVGKRVTLEAATDGR